VQAQKLELVALPVQLEKSARGRVPRLVDAPPVLVGLHGGSPRAGQGGV
jgi:hypothetical protein